MQLQNGNLTKNAQVLKVMKYKVKMQLYCVGIQEVSNENIGIQNNTKQNLVKQHCKGQVIHSNTLCCPLHCPLQILL
ncbi:MAG: hypothetical protein RL097_361 [Candidatus Parcubacteria bacterium]|jgi:hypothetical protein